MDDYDELMDLETTIEHLDYIRTFWMNPGDEDNPYPPGDYEVGIEFVVVRSALEHLGRLQDLES